MKRVEVDIEEDVLNDVVRYRKVLDDIIKLQLCCLCGPKTRLIQTEIRQGKANLELRVKTEGGLLYGSLVNAHPFFEKVIPCLEVITKKRLWQMGIMQQADCSGKDMTVTFIVSFNTYGYFGGEYSLWR